FIQSVRAERAAQRFARLSVVRDGNSRLEKARQHLSPTVVGLGRLIADRRVAVQINCRRLNSCALDRENARMRVVECKRQLLVPRPPFSSLLAILEFDFTIAGDLRRANVDRESSSHELAARGLHSL